MPQDPWYRDGQSFREAHAKNLFPEIARIFDHYAGCHAYNDARSKLWAITDQFTFRDFGEHFFEFNARRWNGKVIVWGWGTLIGSHEVVSIKWSSVRRNAELLTPLQAIRRPMRGRTH